MRAGGRKTALSPGLELVLVRHAETTATAAGRYLGWRDAPLTEEGERAAAALGPRLDSLRRCPAGAAAGDPRGPTAIFASDLPRALRTARLALPGSELVADPRLREIHFGAFEGASWQENLERWGDRFRDWLADPRGVAPPGGERLGELEARVGEWLRGLPARGRVVAFLHGGSLRAAWALAEGRPIEELLAEAVPPCAVVVPGTRVRA